MDLASRLDLWAMLREATPTVTAVLCLLAAMSVASWAVILHKLFTLVPAARASRLALARVLDTLDRGRELAAALAVPGGGPGVPLARAMHAARMVRDRTDSRAVARAARLAGTQALRAHERGIGILAACSGAAPFIGLFGTVWGVMHAFHALGQVRVQALTLVAPGIAEALIATALGLAVAVPANVAFNLCVGLVDGLERDLEAFETAVDAPPGSDAGEA